MPPSVVEIWREFFTIRAGVFLFSLVVPPLTTPRGRACPAGVTERLFPAGKGNRPQVGPIKEKSFVYVFWVGGYKQKQRTILQ